MNYDDYMKSDAWDKRRRAAIKVAGYHCQVCGVTNKALDVHHNNYDNLGHEKPSDLIALCEDCHRLFHERLPRVKDALWFLTTDQKNEIEKMVIVQGKKGSMVAIKRKL